MRRLSILISIIFLTSSLTSAQASTPLPSKGGACSKVGSFADTSRVRYVCIKSGKKKVWSVWKRPTTTNNSGNKGGTSPSASPTPTSNPAVSQIAGSSCTNAGEWKVVKEKRYFCEGTNRKGNFLWDKGTSTSFNAPMPITLPVAQTGSITFANALSHVSEISTLSWQRVQDVIDKAEAIDIPHQLLVGPNTTTVTKTIEESLLTRQFKLWSGFQQTKYLTVIAYNFSDMNWAAATNDAVIQKRGYPVSLNPAGIDRAKQSCHTANNCDGGNAGLAGGIDEAIEFVGVTTEEQWDPTQNGEVGHEYTHTVTSAQFIGTAAENRNYYEQMFMPCWLNEGLSNASGIGASTTSLRQYVDMRDGQVTTIHYLPTELKGFTAAGLKDFLANQISSQSAANTCYGSPAYSLGYSIGFAATEVLFAIGGPQSVMALVSRGAMGDSFSQAFKNVYGISWDEGSTILGQILAAEYAAKPMRT